MAYPNNRPKTTRSRFRQTNRQNVTAIAGTINTVAISVPTNKLIVTYDQDMNQAVLPPASYLPFVVNPGGSNNLPIAAQWNSSTTLWVWFQNAVVVTDTFFANATGALLTAQGGAIEEFSIVL